MICLTTCTQVSLYVWKSGKTSAPWFSSAYFGFILHSLLQMKNGWMDSPFTLQYHVPFVVISNMNHSLLKIQLWSELTCFSLLFLGYRCVFSFYLLGLIKVHFRKILSVLVWASTIAGIFLLLFVLPHLLVSPSFCCCLQLKALWRVACLLCRRI